MSRLTNKTDAPKPNATNTCLNTHPYLFCFQCHQQKKSPEEKPQLSRLRCNWGRCTKTNSSFLQAETGSRGLEIQYARSDLERCLAICLIMYQFTFDTKVKHFPTNLSVMALSAQQDEKAWRVNEWNVSENDGTIFTNTWLWYPLCVRSAKPDICTWED